MRKNLNRCGSTPLTWSPLLNLNVKWFFLAKKYLPLVLPQPSSKQTLNSLNTLSNSLSSHYVTMSTLQTFLLT